MKDLDTNRNEAVKDMRKTLAALSEASTRLEILTQCDLLGSQVFYLRQMTAHTITRNRRGQNVLYPDRDWSYYRKAVKEEHAS